jgi:hypothetical protein
LQGDATPFVAARAPTGNRIVDLFPSRRPVMKNKVIWALGALNLLLLLGLVTRLTAPAQAQAARPGDYLMIPGEIIGGNNAVIWVIDSRNQQLSAVSVDQKGTALDMMAPLPLARILEGGGARP